MFGNPKYIKLFKLTHEIKKMPFGRLLENMSVGEYMAMAAFQKYERDNDGKNITVALLAEYLEVSVPAVSRMLRHLEQRKLIRRITDEGCRRNTYVIISKEGAHVFAQNTAALHNYMERVLSHFTVEEADAMVKLHEKLSKYMTAELPEEIDAP